MVQLNQKLCTNAGLLIIYEHLQLSFSKHRWDERWTKGEHKKQIRRRRFVVETINWYHWQSSERGRLGSVINQMKMQFKFSSFFLLITRQIVSLFSSPRSMQTWIILQRTENDVKRCASEMSCERISIVYCSNYHWNKERNKQSTEKKLLR